MLSFLVSLALSSFELLFPPPVSHTILLYPCLSLVLVFCLPLRPAFPSPVLSIIMPAHFPSADIHFKTRGYERRDRHVDMEPSAPGAETASDAAK